MGQGPSTGNMSNEPVPHCGVCPTATSSERSPAPRKIGDTAAQLNITGDRRPDIAINSRRVLGRLAWGG